MATLHMCQNLTTCQYLSMAETNGNKNCEAHGGAFPYHIETFVQEDSSRSGRLGELTERKAAMGIVGETESKAKKQGIHVKTEIPEAVSSVVETIINHATKENVDLIIVGTRGLGGFKKMLLGSVSSGIVSHAHCPVLVVR